MSIARRSPILGIIIGIALTVVGISSSNNGLIVVGIVLVGLGIFRQIRGA